MNTEKLFDEGEYMVVYLYPETVKLDERQFFLWNLEEMSTVSNGASCEGIPGYRYKSCFSSVIRTYGIDTVILLYKVVVLICLTIMISLTIIAFDLY